jgi:hypothetical protein
MSVVVDTGDAGQGLTAKSQGGDVKQIVDAGHLAGGVAGKGADGIIRLHALAVVTHGDQADAGVFQLDADVPGAGVDGVFNQFLDDGSRPLHHFAGGDLVRHFGRQQPYAPARFRCSLHVCQRT